MQYNKIYFLKLSRCGLPTRETINKLCPFLLLYHVITLLYISTTILELFRAIYNQNFNDFEIILIDDGSLDNTVKDMKRYKTQYNNIKLIAISHSGPLLARIEGIKIASGEYLIFIDSDDLIEPYTLKTIYDATIKHNNPDIVAFNSSRNTQNDDNKFYKVNTYKSTIYGLIVALGYAIKLTKKEI